MGFFRAFAKWIFERLPQGLISFIESAERAWDTLTNGKKGLLIIVFIFFVLFLTYCSTANKTTKTDSDGYVTEPTFTRDEIESCEVVSVLRQCTIRQRGSIPGEISDFSKAQRKVNIVFKDGSKTTLKTGCTDSKTFFLPTEDIGAACYSLIPTHELFYCKFGFPWALEGNPGSIEPIQCLPLP